MLKTNSKKAIDNIWLYLEGFIDIINDERIAYEADKNYLQPGNRKELAAVIYETYEVEKKKGDHLNAAGRITDAALFEEWAQGLSMCGVFDYYTYRDDTNPVNILGDILEETETERNRFNEDKAAELMTKLIYREVMKYRN